MGRSAAPTLQGRARELALLTDAIDRAAAGTGTVVVVEGDAGIGKTRLLDEVAVHAHEHGVAVRRGGAAELERGRPFGALVEALDLAHPDHPDLAALAGAIAEAAASPDARFLAQEAVLDHVDRVTDKAPLLLALDDIHWSDRATLATAWSLARRVDRSPVVLVLAARPTPRSADLDRLFADCIRAGAVVIPLGPLAPQAVGALASEVVGASPGTDLLDRLAGTGGNPFFVIELLSALADDGSLEAVDGATELRTRPMPPELRAALLRRIGALGTDAEEILGVAAVLGDRFAVDDLAALLDRPVAATQTVVTNGLRAGLLDDRDGRLVFRHDLIREALYDQIPDAVRAGLHRDAARLLGDRLEPAVLARHLVLGANLGDADAVRGLRTAAAALAEHEPDAAAEVLERALELERDAIARAELGAELAHTLLASGRALEAEERAGDALGIPGITPGTEASLHLALGETYSHRGQMATAIAHFGAAVDLGVLDEGDRASALGRKAENTVWTFDLPAGWQEAEAALIDGNRLGQAAVTTQALAAQSAVRNFEAAFDQAVDLGMQAVAAAGDDPSGLRRAPHAYLGLALMGADRHDEANQVTQEGRRRSTALGQVLELPKYHQLLVRLHWFTGRWDDALAEADAAASLANDFGLVWGVPANDAVSGLIAFHRGDHAAARAARGRSMAGREQGEDVSGSELGVLLDALLLEAAGEQEAAAKTLLGPVELMAALGMRAIQLWVGPQCVRLALAAGERGRAAAVSEDVGRIASAAATATARGAAAATRGLVDRDPDLLLAAATAYREGGRPLDRLLACEWAGVALVDAGRRDEGVDALRHGLEVARELAAAHDVRRVLAALRRLGVRVSSRDEQRRDTTGWGALTNAELEVARLIDAGLRNTEIAERLFVSRRTVETHISRLYAKLGARSRVALAQIVHERLATVG